MQSRSLFTGLGGVVLAATIHWSANSVLAQGPAFSPPAKVPAATPAIPVPPPRPDSPTKAASPAAENVQPGEQVFQVSGAHSKIHFRNLDTRVLELGNRIKIVDGFDQDKVSVKALSPHRVRLRAESPGVTTVKLIDEFDNMHVVDVFVEPDTRELEAYLERLFPGSAIEVVGIRDGVVLRGWVTEPSQIPQIMAVAEQFYEIVHPQLTVAGPSQVQLHVKVMEVQRSKMRQLGFNFLLTGQQYYVANTVGALAPINSLVGGNATGGALPFGGPPRPSVLPSSLASSAIQFAITGNSAVFQGFLEALQTESLAKILAEPILVTTSGRPATVHSGGEFPVLVPQSFGNLSVQWREFGVRLEAVPVVLGEGRLRLDLAPEVSERDFSNSVSINGLVVPGITSRSVNTQVEMRFGETLMIGGLISSRNQGTTQKIPFLGELPWIGAAFSRKSYKVGETELVILVTPQMVSPMSPQQVPQVGPGGSSTVPVDRELYLDGNLEVPRYGPDCPECQPGGGLIYPSGPIPANGDGCQKITELESEDDETTEVLPASATDNSESGSRTTIVNPFHSTSTTSPKKSSKRDFTAPEPVSKRTLQPSSIQQVSARDVEKKPAESRDRTSIFDARKLPGMIQPDSSK